MTTATPLMTLDRISGTRRIVTVMGTVFTVDVRDVEPASHLVDEVVEWWRWVDRTFSTYRADSAISRLADGRISLGECPDEMRDVLARCQEMVRVSEGYFTDHPGGRLDPTGLVKGWSVELGSRMLRAGGSTNHCIAAGGDLRASGCPTPGAAWHLGIADPFDPRRVRAVVIGHDVAVATSGTTERGHHILDPIRGRPADELASVTLVGSDLSVVDALATAAFARGRDCRDWLTALPDLEAFVIGTDGATWQTDGFPGVRVDTVARLPAQC